jgi:hypothetical protein
MEFRAPTVQYKKNPKARISAVGAVLLVVAVFLAMVDGWETAALWTFGISILVFLVGVVLAKADLTNTEVSKTIWLVMNTEEIRIGGKPFQISQLKNIDFNIGGYVGLYQVSRAIVSTESDGMDNYVSFVCMDENVQCRFYLAGPLQVQQLGAVFKEFYRQRIEFIERKGEHQTYLFEPVS